MFSSATWCPRPLTHFAWPPFCFPPAPLSPTHNPTCRHATSIWFDFMEMFILLSKYPFIALGMELDVLLD